VTSVLVGYDGSPPAAAAIDTAAPLFPSAHATVAYLWTPPFADQEVRHRLWQRATSLDDLIALVEHEGSAEADRLARDGVALARAAGWDAEARVERCYGGVGYELARLAGEREPTALVIGSRGLGGVRAVLGSTSDVAAHVSTVPTLIVPHPLLAAERSATRSGPVVVAYDGSAGARAALTAAADVFRGRRLVVVTVTVSGAAAVEHGALRLAGAEDAEVVVLEGRGASEGAVADTLAHEAAEVEAGALVVGSRGLSAARKIMLGSVAMATLHRAHRAVLVVPHHRFPDAATGTDAG
jgi:nucleotide-binding universal stress UspA family protein